MFRAVTPSAGSELGQFAAHSRRRGSLGPNQEPTRFRPKVGDVLDLSIAAESEGRQPGHLLATDAEGRPRRSSGRIFVHLLDTHVPVPGDAALNRASPRHASARESGQLDTPRRRSTVSPGGRWSGARRGEIRCQVVDCLDSYPASPRTSSSAHPGHRTQALVVTALAWPR
jgi:hypothetical protein